jgi:S-adenosylmethionine:tRNA ribosyltransferase-isomerase
LFLAEQNEGVWTVYLKGTRKLKPGDHIYLKDRYKTDFCEAVLVEKLGEGKCRLELKTDINTDNILETIGFPPLPPYIKRDDDAAVAAMDAPRYQTVYAQHAGAVAAPTAGLHFTEPLIEQLKQTGVRFAFITLHVGAGTFKPIATENVEEHLIHQERYSFNEENAEIIRKTKNEGGRVIPVGTTSTRVLETIAVDSRIEAAEGTTELFITPGYSFKITDAMITNFHLPRSTLLALVSAFAGLENVLAAYHHAIEQRYRFYSYGDAMLIV